MRWRRAIVAGAAALVGWKVLVRPMLAAWLEDDDGLYPAFAFEAAGDVVGEVVGTFADIERLFGSAPGDRPRREPRGG